uniref:Uncharacterized protein n=1 Tax=Arundo donax TaxID=35708 RepID=A0A0A9HXB1_ARUDO
MPWIHGAPRHPSMAPEQRRAWIQI